MADILIYSQIDRQTVTCFGSATNAYMLRNFARHIKTAFIQTKTHRHKHRAEKQSNELAIAISPVYN